MNPNTTTKFLPRLIAWEVTRSCPLRCRHCRASAQDRAYTGELSLEEITRTLENIAAFAQPIIILTGGEPMSRPDIFEIAKAGTALGLRMVMSPCGMMVTPDTVRQMKESGIMRISLSLDGATAETHDAFRGIPGAYQGVMEAMRHAREGGLEFQINTTVTRLNMHELEAILELAVREDAKAFDPFLLVPTGRGKELRDLEISPEEYEEVLNWVYERQKTSPIHFKPTCAPHYHRVWRQRRTEEKQAPLEAPTDRMMSMTKGCMGGQSFAFISHLGKVQICGFLETECGDLRQADYDFHKIWDTSPVFLQMRDWDHYHGRCGYCEYRKVCGGCRARAFAMTGDYLDEEPFCVYQPKRL